MSKKLTREDFIERARQVHGDKYDYSKVEYKSMNDKVEIICPVHGSFWQLAQSHINGHECKKCVFERIQKNKFSNTDKFVEKAKKIHGDKYDYSLVDYKSSKEYVTIVCPEHGSFEITPNNHLAGHGCVLCNRLTTEVLIDRAKSIHGGKYDYSKVEYVNSKTKIEVICPVHGSFFQKPFGHLSGYGCPKCAGNLMHPKDKFVEMAMQVHGDKYDYSNVEYHGNKVKVEISCPQHGIFLQKPNNHLAGQGCPYCVNSLQENSIELLLENNGIKFEKQKTFDWLRNERELSLDFYLPEYNIAIECQGGQHYRPVKFFGGIEGYSQIVKRDAIKYKQCKEHGIELIYYSNFRYIPETYFSDIYTDKEKLLSKILGNGT